MLGVWFSLPSSVISARRLPALSCVHGAASVFLWSTPLASCTGCGWSSAASQAVCLISASVQTESPRRPCRPLLRYPEACVAFLRNSHCPGCSVGSVWNPCYFFYGCRSCCSCCKSDHARTTDAPRWMVANSAVLSGAALSPVRRPFRCRTTQYPSTVEFISPFPRERVTRCYFDAPPPRASCARLGWWGWGWGCSCCFILRQTAFTLLFRFVQRGASDQSAAGARCLSLLPGLKYPSVHTKQAKSPLFLKNRSQPCNYCVICKIMTCLHN